MGSAATEPGDISSPAPTGIDEHPWLERVADWDDAEADAQIRTGLSVEIAVYRRETLDPTDAETAHLLGRSRSTHARYRNAGKDPGTAEAERAVRFTLPERWNVVVLPPSADFGAAVTIGDSRPLDLDPRILSRL